MIPSRAGLELMLWVQIMDCKAAGSGLTAELPLGRDASPSEQARNSLTRRASTAQHAPPRAMIGMLAAHLIEYG